MSAQLPGVTNKLLSQPVLPFLCVSTQVIHRCPCTDKDVCGELELLVKELAQEGKMPPFALDGPPVEPEKMGIESWR